MLHLFAYITYQGYGYLILLVWRIEFGVTRMELCSVQCRQFKALSGAMLEAYG
jgi:hypothetical protein